MKLLIPLVLILSPVVFSGCKSEDTAGSSEAKVAEEAKDEVIAGIMEFFETVKFVWFVDKRVTEALSQSINYIYDNFEYNKETGTLVYAQMQNMTTSGNVGSIYFGDSDTTLSLNEIDLKSCKSVIAVSPWAGSGLIGVRLTGNYRTKEIEKKEKWKDASATEAISKKLRAKATDEDLKSLIEKDFEKTEEEWEIPFVVTPEMAPRLKSALADLLEVHGVKASKY